MYQNILVPVVFDHGDRGAQALEIANALLKKGGGITLLHVMEEIPSYASTYLPEGLAQQHHDEAMMQLSKMAQSAGEHCRAAVVHGHASSSILDFTRKDGSDCVVIASHKPGFEDYFLGSTAARVVRHAKCAVHVLR